MKSSKQPDWNFPSHAAAAPRAAAARLLPILSSRNLPRDVYSAKATFAISIENRNSAEKENLEFSTFAPRPVAGTGECAHCSEPPISSTMFALEY